MRGWWWSCAVLVGWWHGVLGVWCRRLWHRRHRWLLPVPCMSLELVQGCCQVRLGEV